MKEFLDNPLLANYDANNGDKKASGEDIEFQVGAETAREDNIAARLTEAKKANCEVIGKRLIQNFIMPLLIMTARMEIEIIFNMSYERFFNNIGPSGNK